MKTSVRLPFTAMTLVGSCALTVARDVRAQDATGVAYADARDAIESLITKEFAESAAVFLACRSGNLPTYYLHSLRDLELLQWGELKTSLQEDTANLFVDYVYAAASNATKADDGKTKATATPLTWFVAPTTSDAIQKKADVSRESSAGVPPSWHVAQSSSTASAGPINLTQACSVVFNDKTLADSPLPTGAETYRDEYRRAILSYIVREGGRPRSTKTLFHDQCESNVPAETQNSACSIARSVRALLNGRETEAEAQLVDFVVRVFLTDTNLSTDNLKALDTKLVDWVKRNGKSAIDTDLAPLGDALHGFSGAFENCQSDPTRGLLEHASLSDGKLGALGACALTSTDGFKDVVFSVQVNGRKLSLGANVLISLLAEKDVPTDSALATTIVCHATAGGTDPIAGCGATDADSFAGQPVTISFGDASWTVKKGTPPIVTPAPSTPSLTQVVLALRWHQDKSALIAKAVATLFGKEDDQVKYRSEVATALGIVSLLDNLQSLRLFSENEQLDYQSFLDSVLKVLESNNLCTDLPPTAAGKEGQPAATATKPSKSENKLCKPLRAFAIALDSGESDLKAIIAAAAKKDFAALASAALDAGLPPDPDTIDSLDHEPATCSVANPPWHRVAISFAGYVLDDSSKPGEQTVRQSAFEANAVDMLRCTAGSGLDADHRSADAGTQLLKQIFVPRSAALRASWNQGYHNQAGGDGFREVISLDFVHEEISFTRHESSVYVGLDASLVDLLAPFNELVLRNTDPSYVNLDGPFLEWVKPRVDIAFGLPVFTEHLAISVGSSLRLDAPFKTGTNEYTYLPIWSTRSELKQGYSEFFEFNLGAHYVF